VYGGAASEEEPEPPELDELDELELLDDELELLDDEPPPPPGRARFIEARVREEFGKKTVF